MRESAPSGVSGSVVAANDAIHGPVGGDCPAVGFVLIALFMLLPEADDPVMFGFTVGFFLLGLASGWAAWRLSRRYRVRDPSSVTGTFDYSDGTSSRFERERRTYRLANRAFGEAFTAVNTERMR